MKAFNEFCIDFINDRLDEYKNQVIYACDLGYTLCEEINANGTVTFSYKEAKEYICEWWDDASDFSDYENFNFGERSNPFENPEAFMVRMIIEGCNNLLSRCDYINEHWDEEIELTEEAIKELKTDLKDKEVEF